jgi:ABC-2 type transport system ATP-binding protein
MNSTAPLLEVSHLTHSFGDRCAVKDLSFKVYPGQVVGLLGPNGAGKTTTVRALCGLLNPDQGQIQVGGVDLASDPLEAKRRLALIPDGAPLYPNLSLRQHLDLTSGLRGIELGVRAQELIDGLALGGREDEPIGGFSRGMRQRAALALSLSADAPLLILDEPLTGLDAPGTALIKEVLRQWADRGGAVLYTSHLLDVVERVCDSMLILFDGALVAEGDLESLTSEAGGSGTLEEVFTILARSEDPALAAGRLLDSIGRSTNQPKT